MYEGTYVNGKAQGFGRFIWINQNSYTGMWQNGLAQGNGTYAVAAGGTYAGIWAQGALRAQNPEKPVIL